MYFLSFFQSDCLSNVHSFYCLIILGIITIITAIATISTNNNTLLLAYITHQRQNGWSRALPSLRYRLLDKTLAFVKDLIVRRSTKSRPPGHRQVSHWSHNRFLPPVSKALQSTRQVLDLAWGSKIQLVNHHWRYVCIWITARCYILLMKQRGFRPPDGFQTCQRRTSWTLFSTLG